MLITPNLVSFQWNGYRRAHGARLNLLIHALTSPLFLGGFATLPFAPLVGLGLLLSAFVAQAVGHRTEQNPPEPFRSPLDVLARFFLEQFVTFPRFVLSGGFARAWRGQSRS